MRLKSSGVRCPFLRRQASTPKNPAMMRSMISCLVISSEKTATFFAWVDASGLQAQPLVVDFAYDFRGNAALSLAPEAGDTRWIVHSSWPSPSFGGDFLPGDRHVSTKGFDAIYRVGNLALGRSLVSTGDPGASNVVDRAAVRSADSPAPPEGDAVHPNRAA